nr:MAG: hypothetical protein [Molluscum contagiosum virus]
MLQCARWHSSAGDGIISSASIGIAIELVLEARDWLMMPHTQCVSCEYLFSFDAQAVSEGKKKETLPTKRSPLAQGVDSTSAGNAALTTRSFPLAEGGTHY